MDGLLQQGVTAYKAGKRDEARKIFIALVKQEPNNESAWGWLYQVSNNDQERIHCLKQILRINPKSEKAKQMLGTLTGQNFPVEPSQRVAPPIQAQTNNAPPVAKIEKPAASPKVPYPNQASSLKNVAKKRNSTMDIILAAVLVFSLLCLCFVVAQSSTVKNLLSVPIIDPEIEKARWGTVDIRELAKNPEKYTDQELHYVGEVFTIKENGKNVIIQVWVNIPGDGPYNFHKEAIVVYWTGATDNIYKGTTIEFWGYGDGVYEGKNAFGATLKQPKIQAKYLTQY